MSNYKTLPQSKIAFTLTIEKAAIEQAQTAFVQRYKNEVTIKGFRKGHAPDADVIKAIGQDRLAYDSLNQAIDKAYADFIQTEQLQVIAQPSVDVKDPSKIPLEVKVEVEVYPEVKLGNYSKIKIKRTKVETKDDEVEEALKTVCAQLEAGKKVDRAAKEGDLIEADFAGKDEKGETIPNTAGEKHKFRLGMGHFLADLEAAYNGMKAGEEKKGVKVSFPKDYHGADFAGKTVPFDVKLHSVSEIDSSALTQEQIEQVSGKKQSLSDLKAQMKETIEANKQREAERADIDAYTKELGKLVKADLPQGWIDREVESRLQRMKQNPQFQRDPSAFWQAVGKTEETFKKELAKEGDMDLRIFLGLSEIVKTEAIELDKDEMTQAHQMAHQHLGDEGDHHGHAHTAEMEKAILNLKIDKFLRAAIME